MVETGAALNRGLWAIHSGPNVLQKASNVRPRTGCFPRHGEHQRFKSREAAEYLGDSPYAE